MTTFADSMKKEIARVARKELRDELTDLRKTSITQRADIAALKKQVKGLQVQLGQVQRHKATAPRTADDMDTAPATVRTKGKPGRKVVFTPERLKTQRARLAFTQEQMAQLLGVSSLSIWKWESGGAKPRASRVPQILARLALGRREALALLATSQA